jgi:exodeoxyribonuclease VII, large subunit
MNSYQRPVIGGDPDHTAGVFRVSEISSIITAVLEDTRLLDIWVRGEITNFRCHTSGHCYFSLSERNDGATAVLPCVMWKSDAKKLSFSPRDGMDVIVFGSIGHYPPQGKYQIYVKEIRHAGEGEKHLLVERWKKELTEEGIFDPARKKPLPRFPARVGVVTSETGAVLQDIRNVISRRFPLEIVVSPTIVQGDTAHSEITRALRLIDGRVDVIIIGRGGGSFEDLFPFNHPDVVRAVAACITPVVSAVGHETDFTLCDFAADIRAPTPSAAAELVVPDRALLLEGLAKYKKDIENALLNKLERACDSLTYLRESLSPRRMERLLRVKKEDLDTVAERLRRAVLTCFEREKLILGRLNAVLAARDPNSLLLRGYCIVEQDGRVVRSVLGLSPGQQLEVRMRDGTCMTRVEGVNYGKKIRRSDD